MKDPQLLVLGGAGYIGRNLLRHLKTPAFVVDDHHRLPSDLKYHQFICGDYARLHLNLNKKTVYHFAAEISVAESFRLPQLYWQRNAHKTIEFFYGQNPRWIVFSSTAAVYRPIQHALQESNELAPISPYGDTKLAMEAYFRNCFPNNSTIFRYFNACGGDESHDPETHFIPRLVLAYLKKTPFVLEGNGNQVRDFVHVDDLARAHLKAVGKPGIFNLGSGIGYSLNEVIEQFRKLIGKPVQIRHVPPRKNDPQCLIADISKAKKVLGWKPERSLNDILWSTFEFLRNWV